MRKISGLEAAKEIHERVSRMIGGTCEPTMNALIMIGTMHVKLTQDEWLDVWTTIANFHPDSPANKLTRSAITGSDDALLQDIAVAEEIFNDATIDWEEKYDRIFGMKLPQKIEETTGRWFEYSDPDTTYEEDTTALMNAVLEWRNSQ